MTDKKPQQQPPQHQDQQPGIEKEMHPKPRATTREYKGCNKLVDKVAIITGGDSGIGRAVAIAFAKEGAHVAIVYLNEHEDALETEKMVTAENRECLLISGDIQERKFCEEAVKKTIDKFKHLDIVVNNAGIQFEQKNFLDITSEQLEKTFKTNIFSFFYLLQAALPHLKAGSSIINTTSVTAYKGHKTLIDYASTKGAIVAFTRSLAAALVEKDIRVNGVAPGPIWTPLIPATFSEKDVAEFGAQVPMKRAGQPYEVATSYVFLASDDASYITGQILHPNGGVIVNA